MKLLYSTVILKIVTDTLSELSLLVQTNSTIEVAIHCTLFKLNFYHNFSIEVYCCFVVAHARGVR